MSFVQRMLKLGLAAGAAFGVVALGGASGVLAQATPPTARVFGSITFNGANAASGATVLAFAGSTQCGSSATSGSGGNYNGTVYYVDLDSSNPACNKPGTVITFQVNGQWANQTLPVPSLPGSAQPLNLTGPAPSQPVGPSSGTATYQTGWNLVAGPTGMTFSQALSPLYTFGAGATDYTPVPNTQPVQAGVGYWAYFTSPTTVTLSGSGAVPLTVSAPPGQFVMAGNPTTTQTVTVSGADVVYTFDTAANNYTISNILRPGQGAWIYSAEGATVTIQ